ncbi:hypothetical protein ACQ4PT_035630 [Festuca glaucescens]
MRRRRLAWPLASAAACLALAVLVIVAAAVHGAVGAGVPSSSGAASAGNVRGRAVVATAAFDAARCKEQRKKKDAGLACATLAGHEDDDKRVVPTGPNPLHNR